MELKFQDLVKNYGTTVALNHVSATLTEGVYGLLGPNGAGKSTLMNIITDNIAPSSGCVLLDGKDIRELGRAYRARLGYMPQQQSFYPGFSVEQFLFYIASLRDMDKKKASERIDWVLELLSLSDVRKKTVRSLSGGMKQRLLLAQAVIADPDILILDEPTAGLDPKQRIAVRNLISKISMHKIVLISTHVVSDVEYIAKEIILLSKGCIACQGAPGRLLGELSDRVWEVDLPDDADSDSCGLGKVCSVANTESGIRLRVMSEERPCENCRPANATLEDVYLHYFGESEEL